MDEIDWSSDSYSDIFCSHFDNLLNTFRKSWKVKKARQLLKKSLIDGFALDDVRTMYRYSNTEILAFYCLSFTELIGNRTSCRTLIQG